MQRRSHRDIRVIRVLLSQRIETLWFSKSREWILAVDLGRTRVSGLGRHRDFTIGDLKSIEPLQHEIAIRDFPIGSGPSIMHDAWQEIPKSHVSGNQGFEDKEIALLGNRDRRYPDSDISVVGPLESEWRTGVRHLGRVGKSMGKSRHNHSRPSVGQVATIENHRCLAHREIENPWDTMFKNFEFAICETLISGGQLSSQHKRRTEA